MSPFQTQVTAITVAVAFSLLVWPARAQVIEIAWSGSGEFKRDLSVAPGKFAELCCAL